MNINENLQKWSKIKKKHKWTYFSKKHHQTIIVAIFYILVIQFDKFFHPVVLYENCLICIFMNINEILKMREKPLVNYSMQRGNQT